jgi:hypothetical protein
LTTLSSPDRGTFDVPHFSVYFQFSCGYNASNHSIVIPWFQELRSVGGFVIHNEAVSLQAPEPGTHLFNVSLINSTSNTLIDTHILCIDAVPAHWEAQLRAVSQRWQHKHGGYVPSREVWQHVRQLRGWQEAMGGEGVSEGDWPWEWGAALSGEAVSDGSGDVRPISVLWVSSTPHW